MRQAIILGTGGHCRVVLSMLLEAGLHHVAEIIELSELRYGESIMGIPVRTTALSLKSFSGIPKTDVFLAIGNNKIRRQWWEKVNELNLPLPNLISSHAIIDDFAKLGEGNIVCARAFIGPECIIGNNNLVNTGAILEHEVQVGSHCHLSSSSTVAGRSRIHDGCFLGAGAIIIDKLSIAAESTIGAGAVVISNIEQADGVYVGTPAQRRLGKVFKTPPIHD